MKTSHFDVKVTEEALAAFAALSGDYNPLHTDASFAASTVYRRRVLHGAFAAGLLSRMAGMHLPGERCLLHGMRLKFIAPMIPPLTLRVDGCVERETDTVGDVTVTVTDAETGRRYVEGSYSFGYHEALAEPSGETSASCTEPGERAGGEDIILITGATGGLGSALRDIYGARAFAISRNDEIDTDKGWASILNRLGDRRVSAAIHCGWPTPDNSKLIRLPNLTEALSAGLCAPLSQAIALASILAEKGAPNASLVLVGSTWSRSGRHLWRSPIYSLGKALMPTLAQVLGMELSGHQTRCVAVSFDNLAGGMNAQMSSAQRLANMDRSPWGELMDMSQAAESIRWLIDHPTNFISGATLELSGGAIP